jgi:hypothetical protein
MAASSAKATSCAIAARTRECEVQHVGDVTTTPAGRTEAMLALVGAMPEASPGRRTWFAPA